MTTPAPINEYFFEDADAGATVAGETTTEERGSAGAAGTRPDDDGGATYGADPLECWAALGVLMG